MPPASPVTMKDIALHAGVSAATVSRALRNDPRQSPATRERLQQLAKDLGYCPNPLVATLMADRRRRRQPSSTSTLAFVTAHNTVDGWRKQNPSFVDYFEGATHRAAAQGYAVEAFWIREPGMTAERFSRMLYTRNIRGILIPPLSRPLGHLSLDWQRFAAVAIGHTLRQPALSRVMTDFYQSILLVLRRLRRLGYQRIGFATDVPMDKRVQHAWLAGYLVFQQSLPASQRLSPFLCPNTSGTGIKEWIRAERPTAIVGTSNAILGWVQQAGLAAPKDIAFASLNTGRAPTDPTGINQQSRLVGATAVDVLISQLHRNEYGVPVHPMLTFTPGVWADGATVLSGKGSPSS